MTCIFVVLHYRKELWLPNRLQAPALLHRRKCNKRSHFLCPHKSGTWAASLSQCLRGDGQNADKSIGMRERKPHMPRPCPVAAGAEGFLHKATGSEVEPGSTLLLWTFRQNLQDDCNLISVVTCQGTEGQTQQMTVFLWFGWVPITQIMRGCDLISQENKSNAVLLSIGNEVPAKLWTSSLCPT